jgi:hypothetical protein
MINGKTVNGKLALIKKFPFISKIVEKGMGVIFVPWQRLDVSLLEAPENLLDRRGSRDIYNWGTDKFKIYFAVKDGRIKRLEETEILHYPGGKKINFSKTIGEQMLRRKIKPDYIVLLEMNGVDCPDPSGSVTIYGGYKTAIAVA